MEFRGIYIRSEPKEGKALIRKEEEEKLERTIRPGRTRNIQLSEVNRLCDEAGNEMAALQPGGVDLSLLSTPLTLKSYITNVFMGISPDASLLWITTVALLKLGTLRCSTADLFFLEYFGD